MTQSANGRHSPAVSPSSATNDASVASSAKEVSSSKKRKAPPAISASSEATTPSGGEICEDASNVSQPPLPDEPTPPPLPDEEPPAQDLKDDGWQPVWDDAQQAFYFFNRFTQATQWENPRVAIDQPTLSTNHDRIASSTPGTSHVAPTKNTTELHPAVAGGYNPAIHGSYDPNASYAQLSDPIEPAIDPAAIDDAATLDAESYGGAAHFNRFTGRFQTAALQPSNFNDESKAKRQMSAFFDVDAAANSHDGRSLKAERAGKKLSKGEVKQFRERRRERKEEKKRAWLRD